MMFVSRCLPAMARGNAVNKDHTRSRNQEYPVSDEITASKNRQRFKELDDSCRRIAPELTGG
jgi:hypothetical protein